MVQKRQWKGLVWALALAIIGGVLFDTDVQAADTIEPYTVSASFEETLVMAADSGRCGENLTWSFADNTLTISGEGEMYSYANGGAPWKDLTVTELIIEEGVTSIGEAAFYGCYPLATVTIADSVTTIETAAFANNLGLTTVSGMKNVESFGDYVFQRTSLESFTFPENTKVIGDYAFYGCGCIQDIYIPASVTKVGMVAYGIQGLKGIHVAEENRFYCSVDGVLYDKAMTILKACPSGKSGSFTIPPGVTIIDRYAFDYSCLAEIEIPDSVTTIEEGAFYDTKALKELHIPDSVVSMGMFVCMGSMALEKVTIGDGLETILYQAFRDCTKLTDVTLGKNIKNLETRLFVDCKSLQNINLPEGIEKISGACFYGCSSLTDITLPSTLITIDDQGFYATGLTEVTIPENVTSIAADAFPEDTVLHISNDRLIPMGDGSYMDCSMVTLPVYYNYKAAFEVLQIVNTERAKEGLSALQMDTDLLDSAMQRAAELAIYFAHTRPTGNSCFTANSRMYAENIAVGQSDAANVMNSWMNSPGHRSNILLSSARSMGIGAVEINGMTYWVQVFASSPETQAVVENYSNTTRDCEVAFQKDYEGVVIRVSQDNLTVKSGNASESILLGFYNDFCTTWLTPSALKYTSSDTGICTVDSEGCVTAVGNGEAVITVSLKNDDRVFADVKIISNGAGGSTPTPTTAPTTAPGGNATPIPGDDIAVTPAPEIVEQVKAFVTRMYTVVLEREPDTAGIADWTDWLLNHEIDGAGIAHGFIMSDEFLGKGLSDEAYVDVLYRTFFDREADMGGKETWMTLLAQGCSRGYVLSGFVNSNEFDALCESFGILRGTMKEDGTPVNVGIRRFVERCYSTVLGRSGDKEGLYTWVTLITTGEKCAEDVAKTFFDSEEFLNKNITDTEYIDILYATFLDRVADDAGRATWTDCMTGGMSRTEVLQGFSQSVEFKAILASFGL